jgi:hypothetical protein
MYLGTSIKGGAGPSLIYMYVSKLSLLYMFSVTEWGGVGLTALCI